MGRQYLTKRERAEMERAQNYRCAICREPAARFIADHSTPNVWKPGKPDWLICEPCNHVKTYGTRATTYGSDIHAIAKVNRLTGKTKGRRKKEWPSRPMQKRADPWNKEQRRQGEQQ